MAYETFTLNTDYGLRRTSRFRTLIKDLGQGHEQRVSKNSSVRTEYKLVFSNRLTTDMKTGLYDFYCARKGSFEAFQIVDPFDSSVKVVRFADDDLEEEFFYRLVENAEIGVIEVS